MRITKDLTCQIVAKLVSPITEKIKENDGEISKIVQDYILKDCQGEVLRLWKQKSEWLQTSSSIYFNYLGQHDYCNFTKSIPKKQSTILIEDQEIAVQIQSIVNENISLRKKSKELSAELEITILKLSTFARIKEQFPEAAELLPDEKKSEIAINIQDVRNKLKNLP